MQKELYEYCNSDVDILRRGCLQLRKQFSEIMNIDPFRYLTIVSVCMAIYRSRYLPENNELKDQFSKVVLTWLTSFNNSNIQHVVNGSEVKMLGDKVDGFDHEAKPVYQFQGCFFHGCLDCYCPEKENCVNKKTMGELYEKTKNCNHQLRTADYTVVEMW